MRLIPFFVAFFCLLACVKKTAPEKIFNSSLQLGSTDNITTKSLDKVVRGAYRIPSSAGVDIDLDGKMDFVITGIRPDSGHANFNPPIYFSISSADSSSALCTSIGTYSTYLSHAFVQAYTSSSLLHNGYYTYHTFEHKLPNDTLYNVHQNLVELATKRKDQVLSRDEVFLTGSLDITGKCSISSTTISSTPVLVKYNIVVDYTTRRLVNPGDEIYLGVKLTRNNHTLLGWIKLYFDYNSALFVKETAIQS